MKIMIIKGSVGSSNERSIEIEFKYTKTYSTTSIASSKTVVTYFQQSMGYDHVDKTKLSYTIGF